MGTQTRIASSMEGAAEGLPFDPTIRIPPIQDPSPLQVVSNYRPSPLEPSAAEGRRPTAIRLTSRSKTLAGARPIGENAQIKPLDTRPFPQRNSPNDDERQDIAPRKRQKVDYVHLPQPQQPTPGKRVGSLDDIPRLNQLNEPPHTAARFPPITTPGASPTLQHGDVSQPPSKAHSEHGSSHQNHVGSTNEKTTELNDDETRKLNSPKKPKRVYTRGRRNWTDDETENLLKGVAKWGVGKWKKIMEDPEFEFPPDRTAVDLKDRYRTCKMHEERRIERDANGEPEKVEPAPTGRRASRRRSKQTSTMDKAPSVEHVPKAVNQETSLNSDSAPQGITFAAVNTVSDVAKALSLPSKSESKRWTAKEDANLSKGFQKYGFSWTPMSKDPELQLQHRTGTQLRDRFRIKFPIHYQSSVPVELPDVPGRKKRKWRRPANPKMPRGGIKVVLATPDNLKGQATELLQLTPPEQRSKTLTIADMTVSTLDNMANSKPSLPPVSSFCPQAKTQSPADLMAQPVVDIQPLPDSDDQFEDSDYEDFATDHDLGQQDPDLAQLSDDEDDDEDVRGGHDVRHLSISGLLNDTQEDILRLPPFRNAYDDTNEFLEESVQLPPLTLWDDLAPRPIFDLD